VKLVREHINEKFSEDSDAIHDMGIGAMKWWKEQAYKIGQSNEDQILTQYYPDIPLRSSNGYVYVLYNVLKNAGDGFTPQESFERNCEKIYPGSDYIAKKKIADVLKDFFEIDVNPIFSTDDYANTSVEEKFSEHSDPIADMGIGSAKFFRAEFERLNHSVLGDVYNELQIKKYNIDNPNFETTISVIFIDMLDKLANKESVPNSFHDTYKKWKEFNNDNDENIRTPSPHYAMHIIKEILKEKYGLEWDAQKVYEKFSVESDPIHDMGIGVSYQTLTKGAILGVKEWMCIGRKSGKIVGTGKGRVLKPGKFLLVTRIVKMMQNMQSIQVLLYNTIKDAKKDKKNDNSLTGRYQSMQDMLNEVRIVIRIPENQFNKRFEIIEKGF